MRNATAAPIKRTAVERQVNVQIVFLFVMLLALSLGSTIGSSIRTVSNPALFWKGRADDARVVVLFEPAVVFI